MIEDRRKQVRFYSDFYQHHYQKLLNWLIVSCVMILFLIAAIIYLVVFQPARSYYVTTLGGQIIAMEPKKS